MRLIADGRVNADACNAFGIYILEKKFARRISSTFV